MAVQFDEHQMWEDTGGVPVVNGYIYIGIQNLDPVLNPLSIFSDRALTVPLANPVRTDSSGRAVSKIWLSGRYSVKLEDENNTQLYQELDNGESEGATVTSLSNVAGSNTITAEASPTIVAYSDKAQYIFQVLLANTTDAVTLSIDGVGAKTIKRSFNLDVGIARFKVGQTVIVAYNLANDNFELVNDNRSVILENTGATIASAATTDLSAASGNSLSISGSVDITGFGTVIIGAIFSLIFTGNLKISHNATSMITIDGEDLYMNPGDFLQVLSLGSGNWKVIARNRPGGTDLTGSVKPMIRSAVPDGWLILNGDSIGDTGSGATKADPKYRELYIWFWDSMADAEAAVSTGRGGSGQADFDAGKTLTMVDTRGRVPVGKDSGTFTTLGNTGGSETHTLVESEIPAHAHVQRGNSAGGGSNNHLFRAADANGADQASNSTDSTGGDGAHNNLQPWLSLNYMIKY